MATSLWSVDLCEFSKTNTYTVETLEWYKWEGMNNRKNMDKNGQED